MKIFFDSIRERYNMPFLKKGLTVDVNGESGKIVEASCHGLWVEFREGGKSVFHPTWETTYYDEKGSIIQDYKK